MNTRDDAARAPITLYLVEDNAPYAHEVIGHLSASSRFKVLGHDTQGRAAVHNIVRVNPDVAMVDINLPDISGIAVIARARHQGYRGECLMLTALDDDGSLFDSIRAGATGYIVKGETGLSGIETAICDVVAGEAPMSRGLARRILAGIAPRPGHEPPDSADPLSEREQDILKLLSKGCAPRDVAALLSISYETVRSHQKHIYHKLQVSSITEALAVYFNR